MKFDSDIYKQSYIKQKYKSYIDINMNSLI